MWVLEHPPERLQPLAVRPDLLRPGQARSGLPCAGAETRPARPLNRRRLSGRPNRPRRSRAWRAPLIVRQTGAGGRIVALVRGVVAVVPRSDQPEAGPEHPLGLVALPGDPPLLDLLGQLREPPRIARDGGFIGDKRQQPRLERPPTIAGSCSPCGSKLPAEELARVRVDGRSKEAAEQRLWPAVPRRASARSSGGIERTSSWTRASSSAWSVHRAPERRASARRDARAPAAAARGRAARAPACTPQPGNAASHRTPRQRAPATTRQHQVDRRQRGQHERIDLPDLEAGRRPGRSPSSITRSSCGELSGPWSEAGSASATRRPYAPIASTPKRASVSRSNGAGQQNGWVGGPGVRDGRPGGRRERAGIAERSPHTHSSSASDQSAWRTITRENLSAEPGRTAREWTAGDRRGTDLRGTSRPRRPGPGPPRR